MTEWRRRRLWTSLGAAALLTPAFGLSAAGIETAGKDGVRAIGDGIVSLAPQAGGEGGGEGGEGGGEGGESGVDPQAAVSDPVVFLTALDVIRAHYLAGIAAYKHGDRTAAAEMFVHPISEVYYDLEAAFEARDVAPFEAEMLKAGDLALADAPNDAILAAADAVLAATDRAAARAPQSEKSLAAIEAAVIADMIDRAALQYRLVEKGEAGDAWLDGYGYRKAAERRAAKADAITDPRFLEKLEETLDYLGRVYPDTLEPADEPLAAGVLLAASARVALAASSMR